MLTTIQRDAQHAKEYFIGDPYLPSVKPLNELEYTSIAELVANIRKSDKLLYVRTLDVGIRAAGVHNIVEDTAGAVERLVLYNSHATTRAQSLLGEDAIFAIKEPILEIGTNGSSCIRVDHPSDLVPIAPGSPFIPEAFRPSSSGSEESSALDWKAKGNAAYKAGDNLKAVEGFTQGLALCGPDDESTKRDLLRNRAIANTYLKRFESAVSDAKSAVIENEDVQDERTKTLNSKSYFRAARAAYELRNIEDAKDYLTQALKLTPDDKDAQKELARMECRMTELLNGDYDFARMASSVSIKRNRLDHADFLSNVGIHDAGSHGNGLFAVKDIAADELILCEKALCVSFDSDKAPANLTVLDSKSQRQLVGTQASLLFELVEKLLYSPDTARSFFKIYDAGYPLKIPTELVDDTVPVDIFRVQAIVQHNSFGCPNPSSTDKSATDQVRGKAGYPSTGLWMTASYTNHACVGNAMRSFIGDMMIMRATRDITKGEEILMPYRLPDISHRETQIELRKIWGFTCDCPLSIAEAKTSEDQLDERDRLATEIWATMSTHRQQSSEAPSDKWATRIGKRLQGLESTYDKEAFEGLPLLAIAYMDAFFSQIYRLKKQWSKVADRALTALRHFGFDVVASERKITIARNHVHLVPETIHATKLATEAYGKLGQAELADQTENLAKNLYLTLYGNMRGFDDNSWLIGQGRRST